MIADLIRFDSSLVGAQWATGTIDIDIRDSTLMRANQL